MTFDPTQNPSLLQSKEAFIKYESDRDVLFVFGAGASIAEGAPLQRDLLKMIYESEDQHLAGSEAANEVCEFIDKNFYISGDAFPTLESVFGYLDYFINKREGLGGNYTTSKVIEIKEALIRLIHYLISKSRNEGESTYKEFWKAISENNRNVSVVTMNYDTLLDESFDFLYPYKGYIDYCIELMNYHYPRKIEASGWWDNPREPISVWGDTDPKPIKLIKVHGSLNWKYCNCCNQVLLTAWDTDIDLSSMGFKGYIYASCENPESEEFDLVCPLDGNKFDTFIVPPSHIKELSHPVINKLLDEAAIEIRKARKIVFVGYSFPEADVHIKALLKKNLNTDSEIYIVDPFLNEQIKSNYKSISTNTKFFDKTFQNFINEDLPTILNADIT